MYVRVSQAALNVAIVASGGSLRDDPLTFGPGIFVITVNRMGLYVPRYDAWITADPGTAQREVLAKAPKEHSEAVFYASVPKHFGTDQAATPEHREPLPEGVVLLRWALGSYRDGLTEDKGSTKVGNSGLTALNLGYHVIANYRCKHNVIGGHVGLFGFDADARSGYAREPGGPRTLTSMAKQFAAARAWLDRRGVRVLNGSPSSHITCWPCVTPDEVRAWLKP